MMIKTVIFDLDGTLLDTLEDLKNAVNFALEKEGMPPRTLKEINSFVGNGIGMLLRKSACRALDDESFARISSCFTDRYRAHIADNTRPYPGIPETVLALHDSGYKLAVVSNKIDIGAKNLCALLLPRVFDAVQGEAPGLRRKPAPDMVLAVAKQMGVSPGSCVYIGDSEVDLATAKNAGIPVVSVLWGFRSEDQLRAAGGTVFVHTPGEIPATLEMIGKPGENDPEQIGRQTERN